jgi:hypothetical protein
MHLVCAKPKSERVQITTVQGNPFLLWLGTLESEMKNGLGAVSLRCS